VCEPVVSVQRTGVSDAVEGHIAWGALMSQDLVAVPGPLDWLRDDSLLFEVLVASARQDEPGFVERIRPEKVTILGVTDRPEAAAAVFRLTHPTRHQPAVKSFHRRDFEAVLASDPDVWTALEAVRAVPAGIQDFPRDQILGPVRDWEAVLRRDLVRDHSRGTVGELGSLWCSFVPWCDCPGRWW